MNLKKILSVMLLGAMLVGFSACDNNEPEENNNGSGTEQTDPNSDDSGSGTTNPTTSTYTVTITVNDEANGTVVGAGKYEEGDTATLTVSANEGYTFYAWNDSVTDNPRTIVVTCDTTITALFVHHNGHEYVDLGLPSGTLWATMNVGATFLEHSGSFFAWGETEPKSEYSWSTYKHGSDYDKLTKYCYDSCYGKDGFTDNKPVLDLEDDAAHINWGGNWRIPTWNEICELVNNCTMTYKYYEDTNRFYDFIFKGPNGNSILLPTAGFRKNSFWIDQGILGSYWASEVTIPFIAACAWFGASDNNYGSREYGCSVRAVCSPK